MAHFAGKEEVGSDGIMIVRNSPIGTFAYSIRIILVPICAILGAAVGSKFGVWIFQFSDWGLFFVWGMMTSVGSYAVGNNINKGRIAEDVTSRIFLFSIIVIPFLTSSLVCAIAKLLSVWL